MHKEVKRRRVSNSNRDDGHTQLFKRFNENEQDAVIEEIEEQRAFLRLRKNNGAVFFDERKHIFHQIAHFFIALSKDLLASPSKCTPKAFTALSAAIKVLTFGCVSSKVSEVSTSTEFLTTKHLSEYPQILTRILESGERTPANIKVLVLDFISGLCSRQEGLNALINYSALIDIMTICLNNDDINIRNAAADTIILTGRSPRFMKALILANVGYYLGTFMARFTVTQYANHEVPMRLTKLFSMLVRADTRNFGRQFSRSPGTDVLIEFLFLSSTVDIVKRWQRYLILLLINAYELREVYGFAVLRRIVDDYTPCNVKLKYLCISAQDAWGRHALRDTAGLGIILDACGPEFDARTFMIVKNIKYFVHDAEGLAAIVRNEPFMDKLVQMLKNYCNEREKCNERGSDRRLLRPDSPNFIAHLNELEQQKQADYMSGTTFNQDLTDLRSLEPLPMYSGYSPRVISSSRSPMRSPSYSPGSMSPSSSGIHLPPMGRSRSPTTSQSVPNSNDSVSSESSYASSNEGGFSDVELDPDEPTYREGCHQTYKSKIVPLLLDLVDWFTHNPDNHSIIYRKQLLETLITLFGSNVPLRSMFRAKSSITRLVRSPGIMSHFLELKLHILVIRLLIRRPCLMKRYDKRCLRCDSRRNFGRELIQELSFNACSMAGWSFMEALLRMNDPEAHLFACSAGVTLIRIQQYRSQITARCVAMNSLMTTFTAILNEAKSIVQPEEGSGDNGNSADGLHQSRLKFFQSHKSQLEMIIFAFASLLSLRVQQEVLRSQVERLPHIPSTDNLQLEGNDTTNETQKDDCCLVRAMKVPEEQQVVFKNKNGDILVTVDLEALCAHSEYYRGMFKNNFVESVQGRREFTVGVDEDIAVDEKHYKTFLHRLAGCTDRECAAVEDTDTCISLIYLADKYLAVSLLDTMLFKDGVAERFVCGPTLAHFVQIFLTSLSTHQRFSKLFFLLFLRYTSMEELFEVFCVLLTLRSTSTFIDLLREFLEGCIRDLPQHPSFRAWV